MIRAVFRKDWTLLWPLVLLVVLIQAALEWAIYKFGFFGASPVARELLRLLRPAWYVGIVALCVTVVHEDTVPGVDQDWLIRPVRRTDLLLAKLLFVLVTACVPMLLFNVADELLLGFPLLPSIGDALYKEAWLFVCMLVPVMALAATTRNVLEFVTLVAVLLLLYALSLSVSVLLFGEDRCPTCDTSLEWLQHLLQHVGILIGAVWVLVLQYYRRDIRSSRLVLAIGVVLLVVVQLPWNLAFAVQSWVDSPLGSPAGAIKLVAAQAQFTSDQAGKGNGETAKKATQALLQGDVDASVQYLREMHKRAAPPVVLNVPLRLSGTGPDEFLVVDHAQFAVLDSAGGVLYRGRPAERHSLLVIASAASESVAGDPGATPVPEVVQKFEIPRDIYQRVKARAASVSIDYSLTLPRGIGQHRMRAVGGSLRSAQLGVCLSDADPRAAYIRCRQVGQAPNCYASTLHGPGGKENPRVRNCGYDYRPFLPSATDIISFGGAEMPIRDAYGVAHYEVDDSDLADSWMEFQVFAAGAHFRRTVLAQIQPPAH